MWESCKQGSTMRENKQAAGSAEQRRTVSEGDTAARVKLRGRADGEAEGSLDLADLGVAPPDDIDVCDAREGDLRFVVAPVLENAEGAQRLV